MTVYDQFEDINVPELSPPAYTSRVHSYFARKTTRHDDSDHSSVSDSEGSGDLDSPVWWDALHSETHGLHRYKEFLREQIDPSSLHEPPKAKASLSMAKTQAVTKPLKQSKSVALPSRSKAKEDHTHIVEVMQDSHDLSGSVDYCFWSMNGCPCQCAKCQ